MARERDCQEKAVSVGNAVKKKMKKVQQRDVGNAMCDESDNVSATANGPKFRRPQPPQPIQALQEKSCTGFPVSPLSLSLSLPPSPSPKVKASERRVLKQLIKFPICLSRMCGRYLTYNILDCYDMIWGSVSIFVFREQWDTTCWHEPPLSGAKLPVWVIVHLPLLCQNLFHDGNNHLSSRHVLGSPMGST